MAMPMSRLAGSMPDTVTLGAGGLRVSAIGLGTMTFGRQVAEPDARAILDRAVERGVTLLDCAEMYPVPPSADAYGASEAILGRWLRARPGLRDRLVLATKVAGPTRDAPWIRVGAGLTAADIEAACEGSLRRLQVDVIDLYQIHWPERHVPVFGRLYYDPRQEQSATPILEQLEALGRLVRAGKVRHVGLSNETPYGVHEFVRLAEAHSLPRVVSVQNPYSLIHRSHDNALDETCHRLQIGLLAYSPLGYSLLTGKYDTHGFDDAGAPRGRMSLYERSRRQRWGRPAALAAARRYNRLAREHGLTPVQLALAFCYRSWRVASTLLGVTTLAQLDENLDAWGVSLSPELLDAVDAIRLEVRDPAQ